MVLALPDSTYMYIMFYWLGSVRKKEKPEHTDHLCLSQAKLPAIKANTSLPEFYLSAHPTSLSVYTNDHDKMEWNVK